MDEARAAELARRPHNVASAVVNRPWFNKWADGTDEQQISTDKTGDKDMANKWMLYTYTIILFS